MMEKNQIFENIMNRTSVRSYTDMPVEPEKVEMMLRAGMAAPSACNKQPWHFVEKSYFSPCVEGCGFGTISTLRFSFCERWSAGSLGCVV